MAWIRELFWLSFIFNFHIVSSYVRSEDNVVPDFLSRFFDPKRRASIPLYLQADLCCFRHGGIADLVENAARELDGGLDCFNKT